MDFLRSLGGGSGSGNDPNQLDTNNLLGKGGKVKPIYEFDPAGLERAADAAKSLKNDPNASKVLEMAILNTINQRLEIQKEQKAMELKIEQAKLEGIKQQHDYSIEVLREEAKTHRTKAEYEDFLARKRNEDRAKLESESQLELLKMQENSVKRLEAIRKETIDYEFAKKLASEKELRADYWKNKSDYKNATKELSLSKYAIKMENELKKSQIFMNSIKDLITGGANAFYDNKPKFFAFTASVCLITAGLVLSRRGAVLGIKQLESYLFTPRLVKEHHKDSILSRITSKPTKIEGGHLSELGLLYNQNTEKILSGIVDSTVVTRTNEGHLRNFLFYGPPGTGKTLFAKKLAAQSGLNYAIISGGDVVPLKEKAVTEIHKVFDWANRSRGLILFLDEADAFLKKRDKYMIGEDMRSALNSFLFRTSESNKNLMLILATNRPEHLDRAVTDRIDMVVEFPLPDANTRKRLFQYYFDLRIKNIATTVDFEIESILDELVNLSNGFSAREISKLCLNWQITLMSSPNKELKKSTIIESIKSMKSQHGVKEDWNRA